MDTSKPASNHLPGHCENGKPVFPRGVLEDPQECHRSYSHRDFVRARKAMLGSRDRVQRGRRRLVTQRLELQQLRTQIQRLEGSLISALEHQSAGRDAQPKPSDLFDKIREMREDLVSRELAYNVAEDGVYFDEHDLEAREDELYKTLGLAWFDEGSQQSSADVSSLTSEKLYVTNERLSPSPTHNPLYDYQRKIGWADCLHEEILELISDREQILKEQRQKNIPTEQIDQDDLKFLEDYGEKFASKVKELDRLEKEISMLENDAISTELLHPSETYSRPRAWAVPLGQPATDASDKRSGVNSAIEKMSIELPNSREAPTPPPGRHAMSQLHSALTNTTYIHEWLKNLPLISRVQSWTLASFGSREKVTDVQSAPNTSDRPVSRASENNWVYIVKAHSESELDVSGHLQSKSPPGCRSERQVDEDSNPVAPERHLSDPSPNVSPL